MCFKRRETPLESFESILNRNGIYRDATSGEVVIYSTNPLDVSGQIKQEAYGDLALSECGIPSCGRTPDVVEVTRCSRCSYYVPYKYKEKDPEWRLLSDLPWDICEAVGYDGYCNMTDKWTDGDSFCSNARQRTIEDLLSAPVDIINVRSFVCGEFDVLIGCCRYDGHRLVSLDGDSYTLSERVIKYDYEEGGSLTVWIDW